MGLKFYIFLQLGCFLPATNAVLRICDRIFSRIGFNDSVELNASTFVYEVIMIGLSWSWQIFIIPCLDFFIN